MNRLYLVSWYYQGRAGEAEAREFFNKLRQGLVEGKKFPFQCPYQVGLVHCEVDPHWCVGVLVMRGTPGDDSVEQTRELERWFESCWANFYGTDRTGLQAVGASVESTLQARYGSHYRCVETFDAADIGDSITRSLHESPEESPDQCSVCGNYPGRPWIREIKYACPFCESAVTVSERDIPRGGVNVLCSSCRRSLHLPDAIWCPQCRRGLVDHDQIMRLIAQENNVSLASLNREGKSPDISMAELMRINEQFKDISLFGPMSPAAAPAASTSPAPATTPAVSLSGATSELDNVIQRYLSKGYTLVSRTATSAVLKKRAPADPVVLVGLILVFWIGALIYWASLKKYQVQLMQSPDGSVMESGGTLAEFERDRVAAARKPTSGYFLIGLGVLIVVGSGLFGLILWLSHLSDPVLSQDPGTTALTLLICPTPLFLGGMALLAGGIHLLRRARNAPAVEAVE